MGLIPDLATMRDRSAKLPARWWSRRRKCAINWLNSFTGCSRLAGPARPSLAQLRESLSAGRSLHAAGLVCALDRVVRLVVSQLPGWHTTIFPPYFVAGAVFGGFAMVMTLMIPQFLYKGLDEIVTIRHLEVMSKVILVTGSIVGYAYGMEFFIAYYGGNPYELYAFKNRAFGDMNWSYWWMIGCNVLAPQFFWFKWCRLRRGSFGWLRLREHWHVDGTLCDRSHIAAQRLHAG